ncbi:MAG: hypothetical protein IJX64_04750 [Clostridia bacterium]|nr:hypothetical protein [Clostridia bacterium]
MFDLQKWCAEHDAVKRTEQAFYTALETYKNEDAEEYNEVFYDKDLPITAVPDKVYHACSLPDFDMERVYVDLYIEYDGKISVRIA